MYLLTERVKIKTPALAVSLVSEPIPKIVHRDQIFHEPTSDVAPNQLNALYILSVTQLQLWVAHLVDY